MSYAWELWSQDLFDREAPRMVEQRGQGLETGLAALWQAHLGETVQLDGQQGFTHFNLWLPGARRSITIEGSRTGQQRLRLWWQENGGGPSLPGQLAAAHHGLLENGQDSARILQAAAAAASLAEFTARLNAWQEPEKTDD